MLICAGMLTTPLFRATAQNNTEIGVFGGISGYLGDLNKSDWWSREPKPAIGALVRCNLSDYIALRVSFLHGQLAGRDSHYPDRAFRNFTTVSPINELAGQAEWHLWPLLHPRLAHFFKPSFSPYLFAGFGVGFTRPQPDMDNMLVEKPEFVLGAAIDAKARFSSVHGVVPFGAGLKYHPHPQWTFSVEAAFRLTFSDYLDGISFAANPRKNDRYQFWGLTVAYRPRRPLMRRATKCDVYLE